MLGHKPFFHVIEFWLENRLMIEVVSPEMAREYEDFLKNARAEIMGDPEAVHLMRATHVKEPAWANDRGADQRGFADPLRQLRLQFQLQADAVPGVGWTAVFIPHREPEVRGAKDARIPGDQSLGGRAVIAAPWIDDSAVERDPRLSGAHNRAFRGSD